MNSIQNALGIQQSVQRGIMKRFLMQNMIVCAYFEQLYDVKCACKIVRFQVCFEVIYLMQVKKALDINNI